MVPGAPPARGCRGWGRHSPARLGTAPPRVNAPRPAPPGTVPAPGHRGRGEKQREELLGAEGRRRRSRRLPRAGGSPGSRREPPAAQPGRCAPDAQRAAPLCWALVRIRLGVILGESCRYCFKRRQKRAGVNLKCSKNGTSPRFNSSKGPQLNCEGANVGRGRLRKPSAFHQLPQLQGGLISSTFEVR